MRFRKPVLLTGTIGLVMLLLACGGGSSSPPPPSFSFSISPAAALVSQGSTSVPVNIGIVAVNGFQSTVSVSIQGLPAGAATSPISPFSLTPGSSQAVTFTVSSTVDRGNYPLTIAGSSGSLTASLGFLLTVSGAPVSGPTQDFKRQVIYQIVTDRFFDGDATNNDPPQSRGLFDSTKKNFQMYWGGDLAGIQQKMAYLAGMGVTALWISPPLDNLNLGTPNAPFHGFWARDLQRIEEHFGDVNNTWAAFDNLVTAAHQNGIRVIVDFAANHSNPNDAGELGALFDQGAPFASFVNDPAPPNNFFHHNPSISNFNDPYQVQYFTLFDLADLNQENAAVDDYLKRALLRLMQHGADGFRLDAVKHATWGWQYTLANQAFTAGPTFLFGEWFQGSTGDSLYPDSVKFANRSGISLLDFPLASAFRDVFAYNGPFSEIENTLSQEQTDFVSPNDLVTFFDSHDFPRLLSANNNQNRLHEALALLLACRGIPVVLYGDEQSLHNDTNGGQDPYNRVWMSSFNVNTTAYQLVRLMANLRQTNPALAYGTWQQRWINPDVYILERQFANDVALIAVNKNDTASFNITGLFTSLPAGSYQDYLGGLLGGFGIQVSDGGGNNPVAAFPLPPHTVSVWQFLPSVPDLVAGSIGPQVGQAGIVATIAGQSFGAAPGAVRFAATPATVRSWSDSTVTFTVPNVAPGAYSVQLQTSSGGVSNFLPFTVLTGPQVAVTFTVNNAPPGGTVYLTGNTVELGNSAADPSVAVGLLLGPNPPTWFIDASVPAAATIQFQFFEVLAGGGIVLEGTTHTYTAPASGVGAVTVNW